MSKKTTAWGMAAVALLGASGLAWWVQNKPASEKATAPKAGAAPAPAPGPGGPPGGNRAPGVEVAKVRTESLQDDAQAVGSLRSRQAVMVRPEVAGRIAHIGFADGQRVKKGQLLFQLDDVLQQAELKQAEAQVSIARANLKRNRDLLAEKFVSQRAVEESEAALQVAEAQQALAQARLSRMRIVAPFDGAVGIRVVNLGDYVKDGADMVNLEDASTLLVDFRLPERYQAKLSVGQPVKVELDALPGQSFTAKVQAADPLVDANGRSVLVRAVLSAAPGSPLRPGLFARTTTVFATTDAALIVPEEAIVPQAGKQYVFVLDAEGEGEARKLLSRKVEVKLGIRRANSVQVLGGVKAGDTVVVAGQQRLQKDGTPVRVVELGRGGAGGKPGGGKPDGKPEGKPAEAPVADGAKKEAGN